MRSPRTPPSWIARACAVAVAAAAAPACGPWFPNQMLDAPDEQLARMRPARLELELERLRPELPPPPVRAVVSTVSGTNIAGDIDVADVRAALPGPDGEAVATRYAQLRRTLADYLSARERWVWLADLPATHPMANGSRTAPPFPRLQVPAELPPEFAGYIRGAIAYHQGRTEEARRCWQSVLALPPAQRRHRSTWASFMLGRSWMTNDSAQAEAWFVRVGQLASEGYADRLGLAAESIGWQARMELDRSNTVAAIAGYIRHYASGDPTAIQSLRTAVRQLMNGPPAVRLEAARNVTVQRVVTAFAVSASRHSWDDTPLEKTWPAIWLKSLEAASAADLADADRIAWMAYNAADFAAAGRWLALAPAESLVAQWLRAKLLLRAGRLDDATRIIAELARHFPDDPVWAAAREDPSDGYGTNPTDKPLGELGVLSLARGQYFEALDALVRGRYWLDAAYVAERVLSVDELSAYVDATWPQPATNPPPPQAYEAYSGFVAPERIATRIRDLLARRLVRMERYADAARYFGDDRRPALMTYAQALQSGRDPARSSSERALALWHAAQTARHNGLELMGTEADPDWAALGGSYELDPAFEFRTNTPPGGVALQATRDERARVRRHAPEVKPPVRYHYREIAAALAWQAAALMPDQSPDTAAVLWEAGCWIKNRAPDRADRFYKALVRRCGRTPLGAEADRLRWFPEQWPPAAAPAVRDSAHPDATR